MKDAGGGVQNGLLLRRSSASSHRSHIGVWKIMAFPKMSLAKRVILSISWMVVVQILGRACQKLQDFWSEFYRNNFFFQIFNVKTFKSYSKSELLMFLGFFWGYGNMGCAEFNKGIQKWSLFPQSDQTSRKNSYF